LSKRRFVIRTLHRWLRPRSGSSLTPSPNGTPRETNRVPTVQKLRRLRQRTTSARSGRATTTVTGTHPNLISRPKPIRGSNAFWKSSLKRTLIRGASRAVVHAFAANDFQPQVPDVTLSGSLVALVIAQFSNMPRAFRLMPRAFRLMRFELEWFEGKPLLPTFHVLRRSAGIQSALDWTR
jgi:hypothetical protein